jgi:hypothetical protein
MSIKDFDPRQHHSASNVLKQVGTLVVRPVAPSVRAARTGTGMAAGAIERLSDSTLSWLAASSIGLGAGLYLSGRHRLALVAGLAPALLAAVTMESHRSPRAGRSRSSDEPADLPSGEA